MSKLTRRLLFAMNSHPLLIDKLLIFWDNTVDIIATATKYYEIKAFIQNLKWMIPAAWNFRSWDYNFNIELFCRSLEQTGNTLIKHGWSIHSVKEGRRAIFAAHLLRKAYTYECFDDKSYTYLSKQNPVSIDNHGLTRKYKQNEKFYDKLRKIIDKRVTKETKERKEYAWKYLIKHLESFWD